MNDRVSSLLDRYDIELEKFTPKRIEDANEGLNSLGHLRWMIQTMQAEGSSWSERKLNRWLGFVQGTMWALGVRGILELRDESRHLYDGEEDN